MTPLLPAQSEQTSAMARVLLQPTSIGPDGKTGDVIDISDKWDAMVAENAHLRGWLIEFAKRIERDRREPDKLLIEVTSMRAIAEGLR